MARVQLPREFEQLAFAVGIEDWIRAVFACNQYVDTKAPWALRKTDPDRMRAVLMTLFRVVRTLAIALRPGVDRMSVVLGKRGSVRVDLCVRRFLYTKNTNTPY